MIKKAIIILTLVSFSLIVSSQNIGDTIKIQSFDYSSHTRDTMVSFPTDTSIKYEKIWMLYNMRCKGANVSTGTSRNLGCGEWDYSCNTYLHDSTRFDSTEALVSNYTISNFTGTTFNYSTLPIYDFYRKFEKKTTILSTTSEDIDTIGTGTIVSREVFPTRFNTGKSQFVYTASELAAAGIVAGNIDALLLDVGTAGTRANQFKIKLKATNKTVLIADSIDLIGFTEVFYSTTQFASGLNRFQFHTPFVWNGTSNIIVEFSFNGIQTGTDNLINCHSLTNGGISGGGDYTLEFDRSNYIDANSYKGVGGSTNRTMEAWIKTNTIGGEILSWGANATGEKWNWRTTTNGYLRIEISGAGVVGGTNVADGNWHHVVAVLNGNLLSNVDFYVDGVLDTKTANPATLINTNISTGINVQVNKGIHNRYLVGEMDGIRIWNTNLSIATINEWKRKKITPSHPNYSNLELNYRLNDNGLLNVSDSSGKGNNGTITGSQNRVAVHGTSIFKELTQLNIRPNLHIVQGIYVLSVLNDTIIDSILHSSHLVQQNQVYSMTGQKRSDSIATISSAVYYNSDRNSYYYDELGNVYDTLINPSGGTINIFDLPYFQRFPTKFEIMSFVTPYGINLDLGQNGKTWIFDVTDYTPFLKGSKRITMERGGQWQEEMDISFLFVVGTPERNILDIKEVWPIGYNNYSDIIANKYYAPRKVPLLTDGKYFEVQTSISGHGQEGEFIPRNHFLKVGPTQQFTWQVWKDCGENPVYPQGGTWIYDRAGWCPGMATDIQKSDITSYVLAGDTALLDYGVTTASGTSNYIVSNKIVTYSEYNHNLDAAIVDVVSPSNRVEYARINNICHAPKITIRNAGRTTLTSLKIEYWVNNSATKEVYNWTGSLAPSHNEVVDLFSPASMWSVVSGTDNVFHAEISNPNGGTDEYNYNDSYSSEFKAPIFLPSEIRLDYRSNNAASETSFKIYNEFNTVVYSNSGQANNTLKRDTLNLGLGCYKLVVEDTDGDGISFWANSDGSGYLAFYRITGQALFTIQPDFGAEYSMEFTIGSPLQITEQKNEMKFSVYPNPSEGTFSLEGEDINEISVTLINNMGQRIQFNSALKDNVMQIETTDISPGIYSLLIQTENGIVTKKLVIK